MASLFIKDNKTASLAERVAKRLGTTKTEAVRRGLEAIEAEMDRSEPRETARQKLERFWREHPLPPPTGLKADKAFYDELSGDL